MNYLSICAVARDETPYLREWVNYHTLIGVERFFIYDNGSRVSVRETLRPEVDSGRVVVFDLPWPRPQAVAYAHCLRYLRDYSRWLAFIDLDEFLIPKVAADLREFLPAYEAYGGLGIYWKMFGSSGHAEKPAGSQLQSFLMATPDDFDGNRLFKSVVLAEYACYPIGAHTFLFRGGRTLVNENGEPILNSQVPPRAANKIQLNHYYLRSVSEFTEKIARGNALMAIQQRRHDEFVRIDGAATVSDHSALELLSRVLPAGRRDGWWDTVMIQRETAGAASLGQYLPVTAPVLDEVAFNRFEQVTLAFWLQSAQVEGEWLLVHQLLRVAGWHFKDAAWLWREGWYVEAHLALCDQILANRQYRAAIELLEPATSARPDAAAIWERIGMAQYHLGACSQAEDAFRKALALAPQSLNTGLSLARLCFDRGRYPEARYYASQVVKNWPEEVEGWVGLALAAQALEDRSAFDEACRRIEALDPAYPRLTSLRQNLRTRLRQCEPGDSARPGPDRAAGPDSLGQRWRAVSMREGTREKTMQPIILGMIWGMKFDALQTFVYSLRRAGYAGEACLFAADIEAATVEALRREQVQVLPVPPQPEGATLPRAALRFLVYRDFLLSHPAYTHVMLTDIRDVVYQRDPFDFALRDKLCVFLEDRRQTIASSPYNAAWIRHGFGEAALASIGHNPICCSGVTIGGGRAVQGYLQQMAQALRRLTVNLQGIDQGVHNYLLWNGLLEDVQIFENGRGPVLTMGYMDPTEMRFNRRGEVINDDHNVPSILHQFDRHPVLQAYLQARFSSSGSEDDLPGDRYFPSPAAKKTETQSDVEGNGQISSPPSAEACAGGTHPRRKRVALIYDNTLRPDTTGEYCKRALQPLCDVTHYLPTQLNQIPAGFDLYLHIDDGLGYFLPPHLHPSAWWVIDTHLQYDHDLVKARRFDFVFVAQKDGAARLRADGVRQARWLPLACDPEIHGRQPVPKEYDISFVGNVSFGAVSPGRRVERLQLIKDNFDRVFIGKAFFAEMARIYSASKIAFNCSIRNDVNMRVFEALASGSLLVTNNLDDNGLAELFTEGRHLVTYTGDGDLLAKLRYYLEHEAERELIAQAGHEAVIRYHTYGHRMQTVLDTCFGRTESGELGQAAGSSSRAADTLQHLLETDDVLAALDRLADRLDSEVLALVRSNAAAARSDGDADLAEGLDSLAEHVAARLPTSPPLAQAETPAALQSTTPDAVIRLVPLSARRILQLGCGEGQIGSAIKARGGVEVVGVEPDPTLAAAAGQRLDRVLRLDLNIPDRLPIPEGYFDGLILTDALEHVTDPVQTLLKLKRYLGPGGWVVISLPNARHYSLLYDLVVHGKWAHLPARGVYRPHLHFFTWDSVQVLLNDAGLLGEAVEPVLAAYPPMMEPLLKAVAAGGGSLEQAQLELQVYQFVFRARPRPEAPPPAAPAARGGLVSIIILTLNNLALTAQCLASIHAHTPPGRYEIIVVDNGSTDGTVEFLRQYMELRPEVRVVANAANRGFAGGNNQGLALARGDYLLFLNNDTVVTEGWLDRLLATFERYPETGVVGPVSNFVVGAQLIPDVPYQSTEDMHAFARRWAEGHAGQSEQTLRVIGFCLMARRAVVEAIGGWDERFGNGNFEDDDFCLRTAHAGFRTRIARDTFIHHAGRRTFLQTKVNYADSMKRNWQIFKAKWGLPVDTPLEVGYVLRPDPPPEALQPVALPDLQADHVPTEAGRWWQPRAADEAEHAKPEP